MSNVVVQGTIVVNKEDFTPQMHKRYTYIRKGFDGAPIVKQSFTSDDTYLYINRNIGKFKTMYSGNIEYNLVAGERIEGDLVEGFALYPNQQEVADVVLEHLNTDINCLIQAPVRFGKTILLTYLLTKLKKKTLILVDKTLLVEQMVSDINEYSTLSVGVLGASGDTYDVTVATFQFLNKNPKILKAISKEFGVLAVDELHVSAATTYEAIINTFPVECRLGLTATPTRSSDKLTEVLTDLFGDVAVIGVNPNALKATLRYVELPREYHPNPYNPKASLAKYLLQPDIEAIINGLIEEYVSKGKTVMVVSDVKKVQEHYSDYALNSSMSKKVRTEVFDKINSGEIKVFSGYNVLLKGVTISKLEVIIHLMAATTIENTTQLQGRLLTPSKDDNEKHPIFVEVVPKNSSYKDEKRLEWLSEVTKGDILVT